jgi:hypothetical protein
LTLIVLALPAGQLDEAAARPTAAEACEGTLLGMNGYRRMQDTASSPAGEPAGSPATFARFRLQNFAHPHGLKYALSQHRLKRGEDEKQLENIANRHAILLGGGGVPPSRQLELNIGSAWVTGRAS